jgi:hypothetical protein
MGCAGPYVVALPDAVHVRRSCGGAVMDRADLLNAMVLAGINAAVVIGCIVIWAVIMGALQW